MSNVANLELCKELYALSGWGDDQSFMWGLVSESIHVLEPEDVEAKRAVPAYDLGYLLRKLPETLEQDNYPVVSRYFRVGWSAYYEASNEYEPTERWYLVEADTPEDATCKLAIELFKEGILTPATAPTESEEKE
jgi:hypothetical protein